MGLSVKLQFFFAVSVLQMWALVNPGALHAQKLRVACTAFAGTFTILWVGKEAGLYQKHGGDMELFIGSSTTAVQALLAGDVDIVYSAAGAVVDANLAGADLLMVGCQYDTGQASFIRQRRSRASRRSKAKLWESRGWCIFRFRRAPRAQKKPAPADQGCRADSARRHPGNHRRHAKEFSAGRIDFAAADSPGRKPGFRELLMTETITLPFDYGCFIVKAAQVRVKREELKKVLRATIAAYDLAIQEPVVAKKAIGKYTRTTDRETLDATYKENVKDYALRVPYVSLAGLTSIIDFRAEGSAEVKKLALEKMFDNSLWTKFRKKRQQQKQE